jgi:hypothetical protein
MIQSWIVRVFYKDYLTSGGRLSVKYDIRLDHDLID